MQKEQNMIILEKTSVMNFDNAVRGARNPMNSWNRSDSYLDEKGILYLAAMILIWPCGFAGQDRITENF